MRRYAPLLLVTALTLASCSTAATEPESGIPVEPTPDVECGAVSNGMLAALQWGLDDKQDGFTVVDAAAIPSPYDDGTWMVAATFTGPGVDPTPGVWLSSVDPAEATDTAALLAVDEVAEEFSAYAQPDGISASMDGHSEAVACVTG
ncbi:hypothetical protein ACIGCK_04790 [Microbacterium sp. NPDC078428]|uniref:hypothetical protein n=1 Tax=Microbacterium sp. NPDC078428 TaxID=3364190 RepID=UPI0037C6517D